MPQTSTEPKAYSENGIVYYYTPYEVDIVDWSFRHIDCDAIFTETEPHSDIVKVICFASDKEHNPELYSVWKSKYPNAGMSRGVGREEVNSFGWFAHC